MSRNSFSRIVLILCKYGFNIIYRPEVNIPVKIPHLFNIIFNGKQRGSQLIFGFRKENIVCYLRITDRITQIIMDHIKLNVVVEKGVVFYFEVPGVMQ